MKEKFNQKLLVEGNDDLHVILALCKRFNINENFDILDKGGITNLLPAIPLQLKSSGIETIGIIIDADSDINSSWESLSAILSNMGYVMPTELPYGGLV